MAKKITPTKTKDSAETGKKLPAKKSTKVEDSNSSKRIATTQKKSVAGSKKADGSASAKIMTTTAKKSAGTKKSGADKETKSKPKESKKPAVVERKPPGLTSKATAAEMMSLLCKRYPDAECELTYKNDFELLISVILSAQTTDVQVNKVTPKLFEKFPTARALAEADIEDVKEIIKPTGYYNNKAKTIQGCAQALVTNFGSKVPNNLEELVTLPGVGRKTANVVLGVIHKIPGWAVDTHVQRLSKRLGLTVNEDPLKIEVDLQNLFPDQDWSLYGITLIFHGRRLCYARNPDCADCPINHLCPSSLV